MSIVGQVHPTTFRRRKDEPVLLTLGGRGWRVTHLDLDRRRGWVEPADVRGKSRWLGSGPPMHFALAQAILDVIVNGIDAALLSRRAQATMVDLRDEFAWARKDVTTLVVEPNRDRSRWWSFAGERYNQAIAERIRKPGLRVASDGLGVTILRGSEAAALPVALEEAVRAAQRALVDPTAKAAEGGSVDELIAGLKFAEAVPRALLVRLSAARYNPRSEALAMWDMPVVIRVDE